MHAYCFERILQFAARESGELTFDARKGLLHSAHRQHRTGDDEGTDQDQSERPGSGVDTFDTGHKADYDSSEQHAGVDCEATCDAVNDATTQGPNVGVDHYPTLDA